MIWKPPVKEKSLKRLKESGNMILAIFGAVALVGTIGAGTSIIVNGPMKVMSQVNRTAQTESQMLVASKMVMLDVANLTSSGDCDGDSLSEPREWRDASGEGPDGVADSDGGGFIPLQIGTSKRDSWGTQYGYCVWDHGALVDDAGCGGVPQKRLQGLNSIDYPALAIISAGPNGTFETPCRDFDNADNDGNDLLEYSAGDDPLVSPSGDDIVSVYSYAEAAEDNLGIWELDVDLTTNEAIARTNKNVEFTGSSTSFGGNLKLGGTQGLNIPDDSALIACDNTVEGQIRRNMSNDPPTLEICEDTGGSVYAWAAMATSTPITPSDIAAAIADPVFDPNRANCTKNKGGPLEEVGSFDTPGNAYGVWGDGTYIYVADYSSGIRAYTFDGTTFTELDSLDTPDLALSVWGDGTYIYVADASSGIRAYSFDGTTFTELASFDTPDFARSVWGDGTYIYVADASSGIRAYSFDGTTFTELGVFDTPNTTWNIWGDNAYVYVADANTGIRAYTFDGKTFVELGVFDTSDEALSVWGDGTYIFVADRFSGIRAYTFDGKTFVELGVFDTPDEALSVWGDGTYIYVADNLSGIGAYTFNGTAFIEKSNLNTSGNAIKIWGDGTYIYVADGTSGIRAYTGFTCTEAYVPDIKENTINQITVEQTGTTDSTLGSSGWSQVLASDDNGDETGIAFVIDKNASKGSAPTAAITAMREANPGAAGLVFKTRGTDGAINNRNYLGYSGYLGLDVTAGNTANLFATLQIGDHSTTWNSADYQKGLLVTSNEGTDQIGYFGFQDDTTDTNTIMFSKSLKIKGSNITGNALREYVRFEQNKATTFFADILISNHTQSTAIRSKSYSAVDINDGELNFKRKRLDSAGADAIVQDGDVIGKIKFQGFDGTSMNENGPTITAKVDGVPTAGNIPTELSFKMPQTTFDPEAANCASNNGGPFVEVANSSISGNTFGIWNDGNYIYVASSDFYVFEYNKSDGLIELDSVITAQSFDVWGDDTYIYLANDTGGLRAYTFDGTALTEVANVDTPHQAQAVWGDGTYIYVADWNSGIVAYTFNGTSFSQVGIFDTPGSAYDVWGDGTYIYVADRSSGIRVYTFDGATFTEIDSYNLSANAQAVWGDGTYIYVAATGDGILVFSFDGQSLSLIDSDNTSGTSYGVWGDGTFIYLADRSSGIRAYTFDGTALTEVDNFNAPAQSFDITGNGETIFVADRDNGLRAYSGFECNSELKIASNDNIGFQQSNPESTLHVGGRILADEGIVIGTENDSACAATDEGTMRYRSGQDEPLEICDGSTWIKLSDAETDTGPSLDCSPIPFELHDISEATATTEYTSNGFIVGGLETDEECYLSLSSDSSSAKINLNGADETSKIVPVQNGDVVKIKATSGAVDSCVKTYAFLGQQTEGFGLKATEIFSFTEVGSFDTLGSAFDVWGDGTYIYVADYSSGIRAYSFDGTTFTEEGFFNTPDLAWGVWGDGTYIYVADYSSGIRAYSFDGTIFTEEGFFNTPDQAWGVWGDDTYIYVADGGSGVRAYSFDGTTFTEEGSFDTPGQARSVWGDDTYIYVADGGSGVRAYNFDGTTFTEEGSFDTPNNAYGVWGDGSYIYVADSDSGVRAYNFDGTTFTEVGSFDTPGSAWGIWGDDSYIYVGDSTSGIRAYSFDGTTFFELDSFNTPDQTYGVWGDGEYIYVADLSSGVRAYKFGSNTDCVLD